MNVYEHILKSVVPKGLNFDASPPGHVMGVFSLGKGSVSTRFWDMP